MIAAQHIAALVLASALGIGGSLELGITWVNTDGEMRIIATATNTSVHVLEFCGNWRPRVAFEPNEESGRRFAEIEAEEERQREYALTEGRGHYSRWERPLPPVMTVLSGLVWEGDLGPYLRRLEPRAEYSDTLRFLVGPEDYAEYPGWVVVKYSLDICDESDESATIVPQNAVGGVVSVSIPVPWGI